MDRIPHTATENERVEAPQPASTNMTISVIVPVYNGGEPFRECLKSLTALNPPPAEIIVVADGDTDGSWQMAEDFGARVIRLPTSSGGPAKPRNLGVLQANSEYVFFVDADVCVPPDILSKISEAFVRHPEHPALIGSYDETPAATNFLSQYKNLLHHYVHQQAQTEASTFWGACGAIRRKTFLDIGGFDEQYRRPSIEDIELGYRLKKAGYQILLCKDIHVKHLKRWTIGSLLKADFFYRAIPWTELILRDRMFINDLNIGHAERLCVVMAYGLVGALAASYWWWPSLGIALGLMIGLLVINAPLYGFFLKKRGLRFAVQSIPWHWLYYLYGGLAFAIGLGRHILGKSGRTQTMTPTGIPESVHDFQKQGKR